LRRSIQVEGTFTLLLASALPQAGKAKRTVELFFLAMAVNLKELWMKRENGRLKTHLSEIRVA